MKRFLVMPCSVLVLLLVASCRGGQGQAVSYDRICYRPVYAGGFDVVGIDGYESHILRVKLPWQGADSVAMEVFISRGGEAPPQSFRGKTIKSGQCRIAAMSSSYVGMLASIGALDCIVAISGLDFVNTPGIVSRRSDILETGPDSSPDYEGLLAAGVDVVLLYGIASENPMTKRLDVLGIPYIYIGEYLEASPLGRAEWIVALSEIAGCPEEGRAVFDAIAARYNAIRSRLSAVSFRPKVMLNVPYGDSWFMASSGGIMSSLISDAGGDYVYREDNGNRTVAIGMEQAFLLAGDADFWLDTGAFSSLQHLKSSLPAFASVRCVADGKVYNNDRRVNSSGGNDFWESAPAMPDVLLNDLALILHPEVLASRPDAGDSSRPCTAAMELTDSLYFYRKLQ